MGLSFLSQRYYDLKSIVGSHETEVTWRRSNDQNHTLIVVDFISPYWKILSTIILRFELYWNHIYEDLRTGVFLTITDCFLYSRSLCMTSSRRHWGFKIIQVAFNLSLGPKDVSQRSKSWHSVWYTQHNENECFYHSLMKSIKSKPSQRVCKAIVW